MSVASQGDSQAFYFAFEQRYRGSRELILSRLEAYFPFVSPISSCIKVPTAVDLGCGRGEWLEYLGGLGFSASGVDLNEAMIASCQRLGLDARHGDALSALKTIAGQSVAVVSAFHLAEHIDFASLRQTVNEAMRVLQPGGLLIMETPNPENFAVATKDFYLDPTHLRPIPPDLLAFVFAFAGFERVRILRLQEQKELLSKTPLALGDVLRGASPDYAVVAQKGGNDEALGVLAEAFQKEYGLSQDVLIERWDRDFQEFRSQMSDQILAVDRRAAQALALGERAGAAAEFARNFAHLVEEEVSRLEERLRRIERLYNLVMWPYRRTRNLARKGRELATRVARSRTASSNTTAVHIGGRRGSSAPLAGKMLMSIARKLAEYPSAKSLVLRILRRMPLLNKWLLEKKAAYLRIHFAQAWANDLSKPGRTNPWAAKSLGLGGGSTKRDVDTIIALIREDLR